jgi:hypothetical protein
MTHWKLTGIVATLIIALSIPLYVVQDRARRSADSQAITTGRRIRGQRCLPGLPPKRVRQVEGLPSPAGHGRGIG